VLRGWQTSRENPGEIPLKTCVFNRRGMPALEEGGADISYRKYTSGAGSLLR
jgi:hypothetical protein